MSIKQASAYLQVCKQLTTAAMSKRYKQHLLKQAALIKSGRASKRRVAAKHMLLDALKSKRG